MKHAILIILIAVSLSLAVTGCITYNEPSEPADPEVVYVTQTPEIVYVTPTPDPCKGVVCHPECFGFDLRETVCDEGACVKGALIEADSSDCGYVMPTPAPTPDPYEDCWNVGSYHICNNEVGTREYLSLLLDVEDMSDRYKAVGIAHTTGDYVMIYAVRWDDWSNDFSIYDPSRDIILTLFDEDQSVLPSVTVTGYEVVQRYGMNDYAVPEPTVSLPSLKVYYPVEAVFDIENRDRPGEMCSFVVQLKEDGRFSMISDCEENVVSGRWVLDFEGTETWSYGLTAYGDTLPLRLKSGGKAELYLPDATEYGYWSSTD